MLLEGAHPRLRLAVERAAGTLGSPAAGDQASSRAVLLGDAVYLITSADPALLAAAAETISERDR